MREHLSWLQKKTKLLTFQEVMQFPGAHWVPATPYLWRRFSLRSPRRNSGEISPPHGNQRTGFICALSSKCWTSSEEVTHHFQNIWYDSVGVQPPRPRMHRFHRYATHFILRGASSIHGLHGGGSSHWIINGHISHLIYPFKSHILSSFQCSVISSVDIQILVQNSLVSLF